MRLILLSFFLGTAIIADAQSLKVKLASDVWPPFTNVSGQQALATALVNEALRRGGIGAETVIIGFGEVIAGIRDGDYDGSAALWRSAERDEFLLYSDAYLENRLVLVGRKGSDVSAAGFEDLAGKKVAIVGNYAYGESVDKARQVEFVPGKNGQENLDRLLRKEVDYMLVDHLLTQYFLKYNQDETAEFLEIGSTPLLKRTLHFAVRKDLPKAEFIIERFNRHIKDMIADGTYNNILQLNWIRTDVDGDGQVELVLGGARAGKQAPMASYDLPQPGSGTQSSGPTNRYYIEGKVYPDWESVPDKYKIDVPKSEYKDIGPVQGFRF